MINYKVGLHLADQKLLSEKRHRIGQTYMKLKIKLKKRLL
jgi:hypothetical protein